MAYRKLLVRVRGRGRGWGVERQAERVADGLKAEPPYLELQKL